LTVSASIVAKPLGFCDEFCKFATPSGFAYGSAKFKFSASIFRSFAKLQKRYAAA